MPTLSYVNLIGARKVYLVRDWPVEQEIHDTADSYINLFSLMEECVPGITKIYSSGLFPEYPTNHSFISQETVNNIIPNRANFIPDSYQYDTNITAEREFSATGDNSWNINISKYSVANYNLMYNRFDLSTSNDYYDSILATIYKVPEKCYEGNVLKLSKLEVGDHIQTVNVDIYVRGNQNISFRISPIVNISGQITQEIVGALQHQDDIDVNSDDDSIYSQGGTTSTPHNPYPSGNSPYTIDPLDNGVETNSLDTGGTWELPFDDVSTTPSTVHSVNLGLYNAYALSAAQVMELANYLFSGITEVGENLVKLIWGSKRDVVISLIEFPLMITNQGSEEIRFIFDTALAGMFHGKQLTNEYLPIDFGTIVVDRYSGTFYDFEPYTTLTLYIPYIGYIDLKPTEVIGSTLTISGYVHLTTGEINVNVKSSRTGILGSYSGTIGRMLPIADADATEIYSAIIKTAASLGAVAVAGVGAASASSAAGAVSAPSHHAVDVAQAEYQNAIKDWGTATRGIRGKQAEMMNKGVSYEAAVANYNEQRSKYNQVNKAADNAREDFHDALSEAGSNAIGAVTTGFNVSRGTVMTSSNGRLSPQRCFLRIEVPHQNVSRNQKILGYPANSSDSLNSNRLHGYTELRAIELSIPRATLTELQELENILKGGFYLP